MQQISIIGRPQGKANAPNDRVDARDCNPMYKRLPAEIISRRKHAPQQPGNVDDDGTPTMDRKAVFGMKPEQRQKWLAKALKQAKEGLLKAGELYDVISSTRFAEGVPHKLGKKMALGILDHSSIFTNKQQKYMKEQADITKRFMDKGPPIHDTEKKERKSSKGSSSAQDTEDMMSRIRDFVREKNQRGERDDQDVQQEAVAAEESRAPPPAPVAPPSPVVEDSKTLATRAAEKAAKARRAAEVAKAFGPSSSSSSSSSRSRSRSRSRKGKKSKEKAKEKGKSKDKDR
eukprot:gnl/TRDRNA2_/TRDRNA2_35713_c0_seq1.p1 gnl/TRDRNA2_/TRDRNA2_35713_c0~~gnl/TRDRNA2_/TRDRNA2_35713_c0_seq1.p1  ORF type:complete len:288 (-),score=81.83 gnl/TRDRNA2_/TRDRNA2_35713_c0_seq1:54-917(-)